MRHCVYPFNGTNEVRRTLAANCDVQYNPIENRGANIMSGMYENMHLKEPKWKSWIVETTTPLFSPDQCRQIIECGSKTTTTKGTSWYE
jgi:hypothetical protein